MIDVFYFFCELLYVNEVILGSRVLLESRAEGRGQSEVVSVVRREVSSEVMKLLSSSVNHLSS